MARIFDAAGIGVRPAVKAPFLNRGNVVWGEIITRGDRAPVTAAHIVRVPGSHARPIGLRVPLTYVRLPVPSGLNSVIVARIGFASTSTLDSEPTVT